MWAEKFKLSKQLMRSVTEAGYLTPKEIQARTLSRINGGQDIIAIAPEGSGKTTSYIIGVLSRLKFGFEEAPRALILASDKDRVLHITEQFGLLNKNKTIRIVALYAGPSLEAQMDEVLDGADIVIATPDRARAIYLKLGLNVNKVQTLVIDDADLIVKQGLQLPVVELANSIGNCQHLVFTEVFHEKIEKMIDPFMRDPAFIEVDEIEDSEIETLDQVFYHLPNFKTKLNLLQLLLDDKEVFTKVVVFVNTRLTAEKIFQSLYYKFKHDLGILNPINYESFGFSSYEDFLEDDCRVLLVANELKPAFDFHELPFIIHLDLPEEKELYISRILKTDAEGDNEPMAITLANDIELTIVKKIEQAVGRKIEFCPLPAELIIAKNEDGLKEKPKTKVKEEEPRGEAFHAKKASNAKDFNYGGGQKAKMSKKKKHQ